MERNDYQKDFEDIEKHTKFTIIKMEDDQDCECKHILDEAKAELIILYNDFRIWLSENLHAKDTHERLQKLKQDSTAVLNKTRERIIEFKAREDVQTGKEKVKATTFKIVDCVQDGFEEIKHNEHVVKALGSLNQTIDDVKQNDCVKTNVKKFKKGTLKVAQSAFDGLKRVLDTEDDDHRKG